MNFQDPQMTEWVIIVLVFLLGLVIGMFMMAGGKWKKRYREEARRREELETENKRLISERGEMDSLRGAAVRDEERRRTDDRGPL